MNQTTDEMNNNYSYLGKASNSNGISVTGSSNSYMNQSIGMSGLCNSGSMGNHISNYSDKIISGKDTSLLEAN